MTAKLGLLFPGQGSQYVGMGRELHDTYPEARAVWSLASELAGVELAAISFNGPEDQLRRTDNAQPAIFAASLAALAILRRGVLEGADIAVAAGHSLGEYTALVSSGALGFEDGLRLVRRRGELMWDSGTSRPGTMAAILGMTLAEAEGVCAVAQAAGSGTVCAANHNAPKQVVISGDLAAVEHAMAIARERGAKRVLPLEVSGAFHSPLMAPAAEGLRASLDAIRFETGRFPVVANVDATEKKASAEIRDALQRQLTSPVRWVASMEAMVADGVDLFLEIGPGKVLTGLARQIAPDARVVNVEDRESLEACFEAIRSLEQAGECA